MELYIQNKEHGRMILESVENGPLIWPTIEENGVIRTKKYAELSVVEKIQADYDMKATNIILQVLPADIYSLLMKELAYYNLIASLHDLEQHELQAIEVRFVVPVFSPGDDLIACSIGEPMLTGLARVVKCYNYQGEGHMARQ
ncbi:hypothetical protein Tco_0741689 [Tanacetum coccineum]